MILNLPPQPKHERVLLYKWQKNTDEPEEEICACCGWDDERFIALGHRFGDGRAEREKFLVVTKNNPRAFIIKHWGMPCFPNRRYQWLCHNCNINKHTKSACEHQYDTMSESERTRFDSVWKEERDISWRELNDYMYKIEQMSSDEVKEFIRKNTPQYPKPKKGTNGEIA